MSLPDQNKSVSSKKTQLIKKNINDLVNFPRFRKVRNIVLVDTLENKAKSPPSSAKKLININKSTNEHLANNQTNSIDHKPLTENEIPEKIVIKTISIKSKIINGNSSASRLEQEMYEELLETVKYIQSDSLIEKLFRLKLLMCKE